MTSPAPGEWEILLKVYPVIIVDHVYIRKALSANFDFVLYLISHDIEVALSETRFMYEPRGRLKCCLAMNKANITAVNSFIFWKSESFV